MFLHRFRRYGRITRWSPTRPTSLSSLVAQCYRAPGTLAVFLLVLDRLSSGLSSNLGLHFPSLVNLCLRFLHSHRLSPVASSVGLHSYARVCNLLYSSKTIKPAISGHAMVSIRISAKKMWRRHCRTVEAIGQYLLSHDRKVPSTASHPEHSTRSCSLGPRKRRAVRPQDATVGTPGRH